VSSIRNRTAVAVRSLRGVLRDGLATQLSAINADLASEGAEYRLPSSISDEAVDRAPQGAVLPKSTPRILIETGTPRERPNGAAGGTGTREIPLTLYCYMSVGDLTLSDEGVEQSDEALLNDALDDLMDALIRCLRVGASTLKSEAGVFNFDPAPGAQSARRLYVNGSGRQATALQGRLSVTLLQRSQWVVS
jgi:hypothetical protein